MARARRKFLYISTDLYTYMLTKKYASHASTKNILFFKKNSTIPSTVLYTRAKIHKGNLTVTKTINKWMIGKKFGEFAMTRKPFFFPMKKTSKKLLRR